jgi:hypothetical protein
MRVAASFTHRRIWLHGDYGKRIAGHARVDTVVYRGVTGLEGGNFQTRSNLLIESLYPENETEDKDRWLTHEQAVKIGLTPGSRLYRQATGEVLSEE